MVVYPRQATCAILHIYWHKLLSFCNFRGRGQPTATRANRQLNKTSSYQPKALPRFVCPSGDRASHWVSLPAGNGQVTPFVLICSILRSVQNLAEASRAVWKMTKRNGCRPSNRSWAKTGSRRASGSSRSSAETRFCHQRYHRSVSSSLTLASLGWLRQPWPQPTTTILTLLLRPQCLLL